MNHGLGQGSQGGNYNGRRVHCKGIFGDQLCRVLQLATFSVEIADENLTCKTMINAESESQLGRVESMWIVEMGRSKFKS